MVMGWWSGISQGASATLMGGVDRTMRLGSRCSTCSMLWNPSSTLVFLSQASSTRFSLAQQMVLQLTSMRSLRSALLLTASLRDLDLGVLCVLGMLFFKRRGEKFC